MQTSETRAAPSHEGREERMVDVLSAELRRLVIKAPGRYTLPDILGQKSLIALNALSKRHGLKGYRKMPKASMIMGLIPLLTDPSKFRKLLDALDEEGAAFFQQLCATGAVRVNGEGHPSASILDLCNTGMVYLCEDEGEHAPLAFVVPEELRVLYTRIATAG